MTLTARISEVMPTRPCRFSLALQADSVFADFEVDGEQRVFVVRVSFDGYGCCEHSGAKMTAEDSSAFMQMIERGALDIDKAEKMLRAYFSANRMGLWEDALKEYDLL